MTTAIERLKRLSEGQARDAAREIGGYLHNDCEIPFSSARNLDQLASLIAALPDDRRDLMVEAVQQLAERFEHVTEVRARIGKIRLTEPGRHFRTTYDLEQLRMKDWPEFEYAEVFDDCVVRKVWRMRDGSLLKDTIDGSWNESVASLEPVAPCVGSTGFSVVEAQLREQFEQVWSEARFVYKEGDQKWESVDTTAATDPSFEPVLGVWSVADGTGDTIEFTLNGIALVSGLGASIQFFRYCVDGAEVRLDPETGEEPLRMVLQGAVLIDQSGRHFRSEY